MKRLFVRLAMAGSLMLAMVLGALPSQAQSREKGWNRDNAPYYSRDNSDRRDNDSYRNDSNDSHGRSNDAYRGQNDSYRRGDDSYRGRSDSHRHGNDSYRGQDDSYRAPRGGERLNYSEPYSQPAYPEQYDQRDFRSHRSAGQSALIVGGSAAAGAGIGALAGGGKGAGIGAIAGGLGGFIYDRLTANHH